MSLQLTLCDLRSTLSSIFKSFLEKVLLTEANQLIWQHSHSLSYVLCLRQAHEVLLQVQAAGVCHTDIHTWHGWYDLGGGKRLTMGDRGVTLPLTLGHEIVGKLVAAGADSKGVEIGRNYLVYPWLGCGTCKVCRPGQEQLCPTPRFLGIFRAGGYSDHLMVPDAKYLIDIGDMSPAQAAPYACSGLTTFTAIKKIKPAILQEEPVVVVDAGGLGLMCIGLLKAMGSVGVVVAETNAERRAAAIAAGAMAAIDPTAPVPSHNAKKPWEVPPGP